MGIIKEFKDFAMKGNILDLAIAVIIGAAFGKIISSFVNDVLMPPIGLLIGGVSFSELSLVLKEGTEGVEPILLRYGMFIQTIVDFLIIAIVVFLVIKAYKKSQKKKEAQPVPTPPPPTLQETLLAEIRDILSEQNKQVPPQV